MRPTRIRYLVVMVTTLAAVLLYLHRFCLSFVERYIAEDLRLTNEQIALLLSAFFWTYALAQVPSGWLSDRYGARLVLALYIAGWSLFTGLTGAAVAFRLLLALRFGCGLAQAGAFPTGAALLSRWVPLAGRGRASGVVSFGGRLGAAVAPVLTAYLLVTFVPLGVPSVPGPGDWLDIGRLRSALHQAGETPQAQLGRRILGMLPEPSQGADDSERAEALGAELNAILRRRDLTEGVDLAELPLPHEARRLAALPREHLSGPQVERLNRLVFEAAFPDTIKKLYGQGWRPVLLVYGAAGLLVALAFWLVVRDRPEDHPSCNAAELYLIEAGRPATPAAVRAPGLPLGTILRSRSLWLISAAQFGSNFGWVFLLTWLPRYLAEVHRVPVLERGWMAGLPLVIGMSGQLGGGWLTDRLTRALGLRWGRCLPMALSRFLAMAGFALCPLLRLPWPVTAALAVVALGNDLGTPAAWAYCQDVGGRQVGAVLGWGNMWGNLGAALSPLLLNAVIAHWGWDTMFLACAASFLFAGIAALGVDATVPVFVEEVAIKEGSIPQRWDAPRPPDE
jgi:sugar phosphate permease